MHSPKLHSLMAGFLILFILAAGQPQPTQAAGSLPPRLYLPAISSPGSTAAPPQPTPGADTQPSFPIRAAFYYPWFPEAWTQQHIYPYTNYHPSLGYYDSADLATIKAHITAMQYGHIQAGIASWWGQGQHTDAHIPDLLRAAVGTDFHWALYYENESLGDPPVSQIHNDLAYIKAHYGADPSFLRIDGRFVVFVYADGSDGCTMADRWKQANTVGAYLVLKAFKGYSACASQPDAWHQYNPALALDEQPGQSITISPGFWLKVNPVRLTRDLARWQAGAQALAAAKDVKFQLVTTFNEWGEGTAVESAQEWSTPSGYGQYLDALHAAP